jgi:RHS repeat-associated protein
LSSVSDGNGNSAAYSYLANSSLAWQIAFAHSGTPEMTTSKQYDYLNRLSSISSTSNSFAYQYNAASQRTQAALIDGSFWNYQYDALGQVISGNKYWSDQTPVAGQQFDYAFDDIGNRTRTEAGGDQTGSNLRVANYSANNLNQYTQRDVPGYVDIMGDSLATNGITVNSQTPYRRVEYFRDQLSVANSSAAVWTNVTVSAPGQGSVMGNLFVPQTPENYTYDLDGNVLSDGRWNYTWDGENRLINMTSLSGAPSGSQLQLAFTYDYQGRWIQKLVSTNNGTNYIAQYTNRFVYDGWNSLAEMAPTGSLIRSYLWGNDLSGSPQGAGGVGGLLQVSYYGSSTTNCFVANDGNGNVAALVNAADGTVAAQYDYGPFGEVIRASGPMAKVNPFTFQTEAYDWETDKLYVKNRYYDPSTGRFLSRDPLGDAAFFDSYAGDKDEGTAEKLVESALGPAYCFAANDAISGIDLFGLDAVELSVITAIDDPFYSHGIDVSGFKTTQIVHVNEKGIVPPPYDYINATYIDGHAFPGNGSLTQSASAAGSTVTVNLAGTASTYFKRVIGAGSINYSYTIQLNFCTRKGTAVGWNEKFPSYTLWVGGPEVYHWSQQGGLKGLNQIAPPVHVTFSF